MLIIGISGGSGSGKTTVVNTVLDSLPKDSESLLLQDAYYRDNGHLSPEEKRKINFDHPSAIEFDLLIRHIDQLRQGNIIEMPVYSYISCTRSAETIPVHPKKVILVDGILILSNPVLREKMDIKVFVDADPDERLMRIVVRDIEERDRDFHQVLKHYTNFVKPMHLQFIEPSKRYADLIIPEGGQNQVAIEILASMIREKLREEDANR
jgi:uridine kinase